MKGVNLLEMVIQTILVKVANENSKFMMSDLSSYVRVAHGVNKKLLFAVVDDENDITYYNVEWTRP